MIGKHIHKFAQELWHINRSITGEGVRKTLEKISKHLPTLEIKSVPSGTQVFDWTVPKEWSVNEAYIIDPNGKTHIYDKKFLLYSPSIELYPGSIIYAPRNIGSMSPIAYASVVSPILSNLAISKYYYVLFY